MTRYVVDASVAVEYLLRTPVGESVAELLESAVLLAPELMDAEVLSVLRRAVLHGHLAETRALQAVDDLVHWPVERISSPQLSHFSPGSTATTSAPTTPSSSPPPAPTTSLSSPPTPAWLKHPASTSLYNTFEWVDCTEKPS